MLTQSRNTGKVSNALAKVQAEMGLFKQNKTAYSFNYLDLAGILEKVLPIMGKHNLSLIQGSEVEVITDQPWIKVTARLSCEEEYVENTMSFPMMEARKGMTEDLMLLGSSISYLRRYQVQLMLGIAGSDKQVEESSDEQYQDENMKLKG